MLALAFGLYLNDRRFEGISARIDDINTRIDDLRTDLGGRITRVETSVDNVTASLLAVNRVLRIAMKLGNREARHSKNPPQTSQAPVDRCTRTGLLPLLPSGPGGIHKIALRGTSARHVNITFHRGPSGTAESARVVSVPSGTRRKQ